MPVFVPLARITDSPFQTRRHYDPAAIEALADSLYERGYVVAHMERGRAVRDRVVLTERGTNLALRLRAEAETAEVPA